MKLIVGLGNPGREYAETRHNIGFMVIDRVAERLGVAGPARSQFHGACVDARHEGEKVTLLKPLTYMNRSGLSVSEAARFYKIEVEDLLVIVDDVALPLGTVRLRAGGSAGGHNGLTDIERALGGDQYPRLRVGIDPPGRVPQRDYVLGRFSPEQQSQLGDAVAQASDAALVWVTDGLTEAMNQFNRRTPATNEAGESPSPGSNESN
ncbi:MAG: aminoacyl-tRNA hydrolase [Phycisphaerales bacterium]